MTAGGDGWLGRLAPPIYSGLVGPLVTQPLSRPVPADDAAYRLRKGDLRLAVRSLRQWIQFAAGGQGRFRHDRIDPGWRRALWIHEEAPQIGDALMDLAPRSLLAERGIAVDLLAPQHLADLFEGDRWLRRVHGEPAAIDPTGYDFAICSSDARRALATKRRIAADLPWVSLAGRYGVPDYHRSRFVAQRLADLLGLEPGDAELARHARQKLEVGVVTTGAAVDAPTPAPSSAAAPGSPSSPSRPFCIAIACGGVRADRTYSRWPEVAARLAGSGRVAFVALGSGNGRRAADAVRAALPAGVVFDDQVGRLDLQRTREALAACDLLLCSDGGLLHLGLTTAVPIVGLFTATVDPAWRLPAGFDGRILRSASAAVDAVAPAEVAGAALALVPAPGHRAGPDSSHRRGGLRPD